MIKMQKSGLLLLGAVLVAVTGTVSLAQVRQIQMGTSMDANPAVGAGGSNRPVQGYVPFNGNDIVTGNVAGLGYFHGPVAARSPYEFGGRLGTSDLAGFARQSAGGPVTGGVTAGLNQVYYLPSSTVSTGGGALFSAPVGSGFDSALVPRASVSPAASGAQISAITQNAMVQSPAINRALPATLMDASMPGGALSTPIFSLRLQDVKGKTALPTMSMPTPDDTGKPTTPTQAPGGGVIMPGEAPPPNPYEVQGAVGKPDMRVTSTTNELKDAMVGDSYMKLAQELKIAQGLGAQPGAGNEPGNGAVATGSTATTGQEIDPFTNAPRRVAVLPGIGRGVGTPGKPTEPSLSAKSLTDLSTNELTSGRKVKPVKLAAGVISNSPQSSFETLMTRGEENLKAGKYLDAAQLFQTALANKPDDPLALIGRSHAELGAGIYAAAAYDLKFVFTRKPGMVSVKYDTQSFIPASRQEFLLEDLQKMTASKETSDMASFLYCYICYETGRDTALQAELKKWSAREGHDEWVAVIARAWTTK